jgi:PEGA domain-containing protein
MHKAPIVFIVLSSTLFAQSTEAIKPNANIQPTQQSAAISPVPTPVSPVIKRNADGNLILEDSTPVRLRTKRNLSSAECKTGDQLDFEVLDPVVLDGSTVIPQNGIAWGVVTEASRKKSMGRAGKLEISIQTVRMANGEKANLRAVKEVKGGSHTGAMTGAMVGTAIVFFPAAPLFLFIHGKDINIPSGTEFTAYVNGDTVFVASPTTETNRSVGAAAAKPDKTEVDVSSTPDGADVEVDGAFMGNTPATLQLASGAHTIRVSHKGFASYEKKIACAGGKVSLRAELESAETAKPTATTPDGLAQR